MSTITRLLFAVTFIIVSLPIYSVADTQVTLQWDANNPEPDGYILYYRTADQEYDDTRSFDIGQEISETIDGLKENITYYFVVRAYAGSDISADSNEVTFNSSGQENGDGQENSSLAGSSSVADSGGSGAGCLIQTLYNQ